MKKIIISIFVILCFILKSYSQDSLNFVLSNRINFKEHPEKGEIFNLYKNYLYSRPDSIYDNPFWNKEEKALYYRFDFSISPIFGGFDFKTFSEYFDIYILSIEKNQKEEFYTIKSLYQFKGGLNNGSSVWCIHRVNAIKDNNTWKLQNNSVNMTNNWSLKKINKINYYYSSSYHFDDKEARTASNFIDSISNTFELILKEKYNYYCVKDIDELGELIGFDYFFTGITTGVTSLKDGYIMTSLGEFHAHELIHLIFSSEIPRNFLIEEGLAVFLGTRFKELKKYKDEQKILIQDVLNIEDYNVQKLLEQKAPHKGYNYKYPFGSILCELVYKDKGIEGLKKLIFSDTKSTNNLIKELKNVLEIKEDSVLYDTILSYINQIK